MSGVDLAVNRGDPAAQAWVRETHPLVRLGSSPADAFDNEAIDAVVIATPIATHASLAIAALRAGKDVFVEKPLATRFDEAKQVVAAAEEARRTLFVGHTFLYDAAFEALHAIVQDDPIDRIRLSWLKHGTFGEPLAWNLLSHEIAIAMWLTGAKPSAEIVERAGGPTPVDRLRLSLSFDPGGPLGEILIDRLQDHKTKTAEVTLRSGAEYLWQDGDLDRVHPGGRRERVHDGTEESLKRELSAFLGAVATGRAPRSDGPFGAAVVGAIEPIARELDTGATADGAVER